MGNSLIIPVWNELKDGRLPQLIESIQAQTVLPNEVIFVDGGSNDGTYSYLLDEQIITDGFIKVVSYNGNISSARNKGVEIAEHDNILFTDAGCILPNDWVKNMSLPLQDNDVDVVSGGYVGDFGKSKMEQALATTIIKPTYRWDENFLPSGRSIALKKQAFNDVGGYPTELDYAEDTEFDLRLKDANKSFFIQTQSPVKWSIGGKIGTFVKKMFNYGCGDAQNPRMRNNIRMPLAIIFVVLHFLLLIYPVTMIVMFGLYVLYEAFSLSYKNKRWDLLPQYISTGWLKRYAYFTGYLYGLFGGRKIIR